MAKNKLNERQEKFCQEIMMGKTQRQAYYSAYPNSQKWKSGVVDIRASEMANSGKVLVRLEELRAEARKQNNITRNDLIEQLKTIGFVNINENDIEPKDKIKALEVIAKILGYDKPESTDDSKDEKVVINFDVGKHK